MSKGAIIIANDTEQVEYTRLARVSARLIAKNIGIPVALVTDTPCDHPEFQQVIVIPRGHNNHRTTLMNNTNQTMSWFNLSRTDLYDLSPWDRTLVVDADMFLLTDALKDHVNADFDFAIAGHVHEPNSGKIIEDTLSNTQVRLLWATVMIFNKCQKSRDIFDMARHVIRHYPTYAKIYDFDPRPVRNDHAFSIACHLLGGYGAGDLRLRNYHLTNVNFTNKIHKIKGNKFVIGYNRMVKQEPREYIQQLPPGDLHFLNKLSLMDHIEQLEQL
jgi:hypothetical protein